MINFWAWLEGLTPQQFFWYGWLAMVLIMCAHYVAFEWRVKTGGR